MKTVLAFDFGASSGRAIKAIYNDGQISYEEIHRFENTPLTIDGHICHNADMILEEVKKAIDKAGNIDSLAFDTWGVDYGLLDADGKLIHTPYHYRDTRTDSILEKAYKTMSASRLYRETGNQIMNINTLFQLLTDKNAEKADKLLFMPDLFCYMLTGNRVCEKSIASTSQMLNPKTQNWSDDVLNTFKINKSIFPALCTSGTANGEYKGIKVITVAGHDTQCAVAAMPCASENAAFLSCGTWSLIGCELDEPVVTDESNILELSNELGANGKINYLKNISGLWLIQETKRDLAESGQSYSYNELEQLAKASEPFKCFIDPDSNMLSAHGDLPDKIKKYCKMTNQPIPETVGELVRCIYESLAMKYRYALNQISQCTGKKFDMLHLLGGGTKDEFLCQLTADSIDMPVIAGPVEATALGNIMLQLIALGEISNINEGRQLIAKTHKLNTFKPSHTNAWNSAYDRFVSIIEKKI
ncbi:MAG: rhamnulokinase [Eubacterium sp.]|nr:rhamnulokinase [Eubacterium sp.]